jgi:hypothetical protein
MQLNVIMMGFYHLLNIMQAFTPLKLYSTSNCHLCEEAIELIQQAGYSNKIEIIEIVDDDLLLSLYGIRIPVLQRKDNLAELAWPFTINDMNHFISA